MLSFFLNLSDFYLCVSVVLPSCFFCALLFFLHESHLFCILLGNSQKPKKKKEEANDAKLNGTEAKPKKTKSKKSEDVPEEEDSSAVQSETDLFYTFKAADDRL